MRKHKTKLPIKLISFVLLLTVLLFGALSHTTSAKNHRYTGSISASTLVAGRLYVGFCVEPTLDEVHKTYNYKALLSVSSTHGITFQTLGGHGLDIDNKTILDGVEEACRTYNDDTRFVTQGTLFATAVDGITEGVEECAVLTKDKKPKCAWDSSWTSWGGTKGKQKWRTFDINTDIKVDESKTSTQFWVMGMIHYDRHWSGKDDWVYARYIGFCKKSADCDKDSAAGKTAGGLVSDGPNGGWTLQRMNGKKNPPYRIYSSWTYPYRDYHLTITMNNDKLIKGIIDGSIAVNSEEFRTKIKNGESAKGTAYLYTHRCMYANFNTNGTCGVGRLDLTVDIKRNPPEPKSTTFDGSVIAKVGNCADDECEVSTAKSTVSFTYQMKRNNDGPDKDATNNWTAYYHSNFNGGISSKAGKTDSVSYSKNKGLTALSNSPQNVEVTLDPGKSATVCQKLTFREEVVFDESHPNGTVNTSSKLIERSDCMKVKRRNNVHTFNGKTTYEVEGLSPTTEGGKRYNTDADTAKITFNYSFCRTDEVAPNPATGYWYTYHQKTAIDKNTTATQSGTNSFDKKGCVKKDSPDVRNVTLEVGDNKICGAIGWLKSVDEAGKTGDWDHSQECVTIHKYAWYDVIGKVTVDTDATEHDKTYWTDVDTANIQFSHKTSTTSTVAIKPKYKTSKSPDPGTTFNNQKDYTQGTAITKKSGEYVQYKSPSNGQSSVNVAKDTGTEYCQTMNYYTKVREDSNDYKSATDAKGCINLKRYKTTFTGSTKIYLNNSTETDYANNGKYTIASKKYTQYPVEVPVTFTHTVKRNAATTNPYDSPYPKSSSISTEIFDGTKTVGYRKGDDHGTAKAAASTDALSAGDTYDVTDTFTVKVYPEQTITLCQQMTYYSELQGTEYTNKNAKGNMACVTISMGEAACMDSQKIGVKNGKNYMKVDIFKNSSASWVKSSDIKSSGNTTITAWAKPGDQIRFNYEACAGGDLAQQYDVNNNKTTTYTIETDATGYLFGDSLTSSPYTATSKTIGTTDNTVGMGPFTGRVYTYETTSPHSDSGIYSCNFYPGASISDFYRIPAYIQDLSPSTYRETCKSDDYGRVSDLGKTITQKTTWTDIQYTNSGVNNKHNGVNATITAKVSVPYNYKTKIDTSGQGGYLIPGSEHTEEIKLKVEPRKNTPANGSDKYSTVTKTTKYRLIEIVIPSSHTGSSENFNNLVNQDRDFKDTTGNKEPSSNLTVCKSGFACHTVKSGDGKRYDPSNNTADGQTLDTYTRKIPYDIEPGVKYCYIAAVWPSDSHNLPNADDLSEADNDAGLVDSGSYWHVSGATCFTVAKRPSFAVLGGDTYAQNYISARVQKYAADNNGTNPRIYGSWGEYAAVSGNELKGFASGATLWGGSNIVANTTTRKQTCAFSGYTFANAKCSSESGELGKMKISTVTSSNPETIANQIITRYTRTDDTGVMVGDGVHPIPVKDGGLCKYDANHNTYAPYEPEAGATFACIGDTGAKYTHVKNANGPVAYVPNDVNYCMAKGDTNSNRTSIIHADGTLVIGTNIAYGNVSQQYWNQPVSPAGLCYEDTYNSISEIPQSIFIAKKIIIKDYVTHIDSWLIADEIITCDPSSTWRGNVPITDINTKNCNEQLTINGPVMAKDLKLYRTHGTGYTYSGSYITANQKASPAEYFTMSPEVYLWSFNQAQRYSQATTTYARELAPRY